MLPTPRTVGSDGLFREVEEGQLVAATHVEEDVRRSRIVVVGNHLCEPHLQDVDVELDGGVEVGTDQREVIDAASSDGLEFERSGVEVPALEVFAATRVGARILHNGFMIFPVPGSIVPLYGAKSNTRRRRQRQRRGIDRRAGNQVRDRWTHDAGLDAMNNLSAR